MKKSAFIILLFALVLPLSVFSVDRTDMIVLLDNSVSVLPVYDQIQNSLIRKIISEHLQPGDTFNLLTFSDSAEVEISREIKNGGDLDEILAYSSLLQPMGQYTDLVYALRFLYKFAMDLPLSNSKTVIILTDGIHDPPPGSSYRYADEEEARDAVRRAAEQIYREGWDVSIVEISEASSILSQDLPDSKTEATNATAEGSSANKTSDSAASNSAADGKGPEPISEEGIETGSSETGGTETAKSDSALNVLDAVSESLGKEPNRLNPDEPDMAGVVLGIPIVEVPEHLGIVSGKVKVPFTIKNRANTDLLFSLSAVISDDRDILAEKASLKIAPGETGVLSVILEIPDDLPAGENEIDAVLKLVGGIKTNPAQIKLRFDYQAESGMLDKLGSLNRWWIIAVIFALLIALVVVILVRILTADRGNSASDKPEKTVLKDEINSETDEKVTASLPRKSAADLSLEAGGGDYDEEIFILEKNRPIQMHVFGQNTKLGISNVHWLGEHRKRIVGGSSSAYFKIFFVDVPSVLAHIECTGTEFVFYPVKKDFFPELDGPLQNCLNKKIKIITEKKKLFFIEFKPWVSELEKINKLLNMTRHPGKPDFEY